MIRFITFILFSLSLLSEVKSAEDDGDWEFLRSRLSKDYKHLDMWKREVDTFRFLPEALKFMNDATSIEIFEGLPHQTFEAEALKEELASKKTIQLGGYPFYATPHKLRKNDDTKLEKLLEDAAGFVPFTGYKMCGGFHPDYAIVFKKDNVVCELLICFGCGDARIAFKNRPIICSIHGTWSKFFILYASQRPKKKAETGTGQPTTHPAVELEMSDADK